MKACHGNVPRTLYSITPDAVSLCTCEAPNCKLLVQLITRDVVVNVNLSDERLKELQALLESALAKL